MKFNFAASDGATTRVDFLVVPAFQEDLNKPLNPALGALDRSLGGVLIEAAKREGFQGKREQAWSLHAQPKFRAGRVMLVGLGPRSRFSPEVLRQAFGDAARAIARLRGESAAVDLRSGVFQPDSVRAAIEGLMLGSYRYERYRTTDQQKPSSKLRSVTLLNRGGREEKSAALLGRQVAEATNWVRDLVNEPAATLTPKRLAQEASRAARKVGLSISIRGRRQIEKLRMGLFLGVAQGSAEEPQLIEIRYTPGRRSGAKQPPIALVGKAITFDSGGLSLKTNEGMLGMKADMAGAAAVLGAMRVIASIAPPFPVHGFLGACENMPSGTAYRPGDILVSRLGKTVEVTNTDAEGRLVLGDVLAFANEQRPAMIIDLATLTGACVIALGNYIGGAFGANPEAVQTLIGASQRAGEEFWPMPVSDLQKDALQSDVADLKNAGERWGGAINAALFLKEFVGDTPWVHLDIAGPSMSSKERGYQPKGATGVGVRTLVEFIRERARTINPKS
jgi:leucyl aminopeptidase